MPDAELLDHDQRLKVLLKLAKLIETEAYREARPLMITTFERGVQQGLHQGLQQGMIEGKAEGSIETLRETALLLLETRFSPLPLGTDVRVSALPLDQLKRLMVDIVKVQSLDELQLLQ